VVEVAAVEGDAAESSDAMFASATDCLDLGGVLVPSTNELLLLSENGLKYLV
jgi:hypothetical protein